MHGYDLFVIFFLVVFLIASFFAQFELPNLLRFDYFGLLPSYRFFAPRPVTNDIKIYAQAIDKLGNSTSWVEIASGEKSWYSFFWNPNHKLRKAIIDLYTDIDEFRQAPNIWHLSLSYQIILNTATHIFTGQSKLVSVHFMITCYAGNEDDVHDIIFKSNIHFIV